MDSKDSRDIWRSVWNIATNDSTLALSLALVAAALAATRLVPQMPVADPEAYARWYSRTHATLGSRMQLLESLGAFTLLRSVGFRAVLSLLAGTLLLRLVNGWTQLRAVSHRWTPDENRTEGAYRAPTDRQSAAQAPADLPNTGSRNHEMARRGWHGRLRWAAQLGGFLVLLGTFAGSVWGWQVGRVILSSGELVALPGSEGWLRLESESLTLEHSPGLVASIEQQWPGIRVVAMDQNGNPVGLQTTSDHDLMSHLTANLTEDRYFAVPDADWIVRIAGDRSAVAGTDLSAIVQIYRSPTGEIIAQSDINGDARIEVEGRMLLVEALPYVEARVVHNPGLPVTLFGVTLLLTGVLGTLLVERPPSPSAVSGKATVQPSLGKCQPPLHPGA
jgi:hypothetical protein